MVTILEQLFDAMFEKHETSRLVENIIELITKLLLELLLDMPYSNFFGEKHGKWFKTLLHRKGKKLFLQQGVSLFNIQGREINCAIAKMGAGFKKMVKYGASMNGTKCKKML